MIADRMISRGFGALPNGVGVGRRVLASSVQRSKDGASKHRYKAKGNFKEIKNNKIVRRRGGEGNTLSVCGPVVERGRGGGERPVAQRCHHNIVTDVDAEGVQGRLLGILGVRVDACGERDVRGEVAKGIAAIQDACGTVSQACMNSMMRCLRGCCSMLLGAFLLVWRRVPYDMRSCFHKKKTWPPRYQRRHVVAPLAAFLSATKKSERPKREIIGVDKQGRSPCPLIGLERWRFEELLQMGIRNVALYRTALTHPAAIKPEMRFQSYERLEFLGDAVLELVVRDMLLKRLPFADEGILTLQSQSLVNGCCLSMYAAWIGLDKWVLTNAFSMKSSLLKSPTVLGDSFEALVGAIYLDKGIERAERFLHNVFSECPYIITESLQLTHNFCSDLARCSSYLDWGQPVFITLDVETCFQFPNGTRCAIWTEQVFLNGQLCGIGRSHDQRIAQQMACRETLQMLESQHHVLSPRSSSPIARA